MAGDYLSRLPGQGTRLKLDQAVRTCLGENGVRLLRFETQASFARCANGAAIAVGKVADDVTRGDPMFCLSKPRIGASANACLRHWLSILLVATLAACGGGGDSSSANVTVSQSTINLDDSYEDAQSPAPQSLTVQVSGSGIAAVGLAFDPAFPVEDWVGAEMTGSASPYTVTIGLAGAAAVGQHTAHLLVGAVDSKGNVLDSTPIVVNYKVLARLRADTTGLGFDGVNGAQPPATVHVAVHATGLNWTATSTDAWIHLGNAAGSGDGQFDVDVDDAGLASGSHTGNITLSSSDGQTVNLPVSFTLTTTALNVSATSLSFGGASGRDASSQALELSLGTDGNAYAWELQALPAWLSADTASGTVSGTPQTITLTPDPSKAAPGSHNAMMSIVAHVNGDAVTQQVTLTLNVDQERLYLSEDGVAFTSTPDWSRLTRTVKVKDNFGRATGWTATADKPWLTVTGSGVAGGDLSLSANPASLANNSATTATVTVRSTVAGVSPVTLKVGMWKATTTPSAMTTSTNTSYVGMAADKIRPFVYVHSGGGSIDVFNPYTNVKVATIANVGNALGAMSVGTNGQYLYVVDNGFRRIAVVNLNTRQWERYISTANTTNDGYGVLATRISGVELLMGSDRTVYRAADGVRVDNGDGPLDILTVAPGGERAYMLTSNVSPSGGGVYATDYTAVGGGRFLSTSLGGAQAGSNGQDIAVSLDGNTVYTASGAPYRIQTFSGTDFTPIGELPEFDAYPNAVEVGSDGRIAGGINGIYSTYDIWLYSKTGAVQQRFKVVGYAAGLRSGQLYFTGDALMLATLTDDKRMVFIPIGP